MGADLLTCLDRGRRARLHRHLGRLRRHRPLPVLRLRRDFPGAADPGAHDIPGVAGLASAFPVVVPGLAGSPRAWMAGTSPAITAGPMWAYPTSSIFTLSG